MKKRIIAMLAALTVFIIAAVPAWAYMPAHPGDGALYYDDTDEFFGTYLENNTIEALEWASDELDCDVAFMVIDGDYESGILERCGFDEDCVLLIVDMNNSPVAVETSGRCTQAVNRFGKLRLMREYRQLSYDRKSLVKSYIASVTKLIKRGDTGIPYAGWVYLLADILTGTWVHAAAAVVLGVVIGRKVIRRQRAEIRPVNSGIDTASYVTVSETTD